MGRQRTVRGKIQNQFPGQLAEDALRHQGPLWKLPVTLPRAAVGGMVRVGAELAEGVAHHRRARAAREERLGKLAVLAQADVSVPVVPPGMAQIHEGEAVAEGPLAAVVGLALLLGVAEAELAGRQVQRAPAGERRYLRGLRRPLQARSALATCARGLVEAELRPLARLAQRQGLDHPEEVVGRVDVVVVEVGDVVAAGNVLRDVPLRPDAELGGLPASKLEVDEALVLGGDRPKVVGAPRLVGLDDDQLLVRPILVAEARPDLLVEDLPLLHGGADDRDPPAVGPGFPGRTLAGSMGVLAWMERAVAP
mmetsp:Transcript_66347/g.209754  ORF Transcript_66347/g.209754 Transcript_66347/m.209754 type:complete len:309 (+) Transcript_66347:466-1392(+)